jgi:hypothetical protein
MSMIKIQKSFVFCVSATIMGCCDTVNQFARDCQFDDGNTGTCSSDWISSQRIPEAVCVRDCPKSPNFRECTACSNTTIVTLYGKSCNTQGDYCTLVFEEKPTGPGVYKCSGFFCNFTPWVRNCTLDQDTSSIPSGVTCNSTTTEYSSCEQTSPISGIFNCLKTGTPPGSQPTSTIQTCTLTQCSNGTSTISDCYDTDVGVVPPG